MKAKTTMAVLESGGDIYPGLGGDFPGNFALNSTKALAANVTDITVPLSGHWIPEEHQVHHQLLIWWEEKQSGLPNR